MVTTSPKVDLSGYYDEEQAAEVLGVNVDEIKLKLDSGKIPFKIRDFDNKRVIRGKDIHLCWCKMRK